MATQQNFAEQAPTDNTKRFSLSRLAKIPTDELLFSVAPADFGFTDRDNIEVHFYSKFNNTLLFSTRVKLQDDILKIKTIEYIDGRSRNYIIFDFNQYIKLYPNNIAPGEYQVVLNVFSDEIGSYDNRKLLIDSISPSRTEVNIKFAEEPTSSDIDELNYFITPAVPKPYLDGILQNIFSTALTTDNNTIGLTTTKIFSELGLIGESADLQRTANINQILAVQTWIIEFADRVYKKIQTELVSYPRYRLSESEIKLIIERIFYEEFNSTKNLLRPDIILT